MSASAKHVVQKKSVRLFTSTQINQNLSVLGISFKVLELYFLLPSAHS